LINELLHALFDVLVLSNSGLSKEDVCTLLEVCSLAVLIKDNLRLVPIIRGALSQRKPIFKETT
jgi:hypothetical protein